LHHGCLGRSGTSRCRGRKRGVRSNALGRSRGGFSSKIHALVDTHTRPIHIELSPGQQHESTVAEALIEHLQGGACLADTGYDSNEIIELIERHGIEPVICPNPTRKRPRRYNRRLYKKRYLVEIFFHRLKRFRAIATRYEKTARNYLALIHFACMTMWLDT
jgi:transposase